MKKFLKEYWLLLLIVGLWLWNRRKKEENSSSPMEKILVDMGFSKIQGEKCEICGNAMYDRYSHSSSDLTQGTYSANYTKTCSGPNCTNNQFRHLLQETKN